MPICIVPNRVLIAVDGPDAEHLLHNVLTADIEGLGDDVWRACALLTPQGKVLFDFLVARDRDGFVIDIDAAAADGFLKRMTLYKLRSKVEFSKRDEQVVAASWDSDSSASEIDSSLSRKDARFAGIDVMRHLIAGDVALAAQAPVAEWHGLRIDHGVAEGGADFVSGDAFGHDISYDHNGGLDFAKGCFVGQEVVSRMQHRGTARRRIVIVSGETTLPDPGTEISAGGKPAGELGTVVGRRALAIVRLDRIQGASDKQAPILAGEQPVQVDLPAGAPYGWPEAKSA